MTTISSVITDESGDAYDPMLDGDSIGSLDEGDADSLSDDEYDKEPKYKTRFLECDSDHPDARTRFKPSTEVKWHVVTPAMLLVFFGICIITIGTLRHRLWELAWMESYGCNIPFVQNAMSRNAFKQCKRFLHFVNSDKIHPREHPNSGIHCKRSNRSLTSCSRDSERPLSWDVI